MTLRSLPKRDAPKLEVPSLMTGSSSRPTRGSNEKILNCHLLFGVCLVVVLSDLLEITGRIERTISHSPENFYEGIEKEWLILKSGTY